MSPTILKSEYGIKISAVIVACILCISPCSIAESAGKGEGQRDNMAIKELKEELNQLKYNISILDKNISAKADDSKLYSIEGGFNDKIYTLWNNFIANAALWTALLVGAIGAAFVSIYKLVKDSVIKSANEQINLKLHEHMESMQAVVQGIFYTNLSHSYFNFDSPDASELIKNGFSNLGTDSAEKILLNSYIGSRMALYGLEHLDKLMAQSKKREAEKRESFADKLRRCQLNLLNNHIYSRSLELMATKYLNGRQIDSQEIANLMDKTDDCIHKINSVPRDEQWYEIYDSCIIALIKHGDSDERARGVKYAQKICAGWRPSASHCIVPSEYIERFRKDYLS